MADLKQIALQRKLDAAEASGDKERAALYRQRLTAAEKVAAPQAAPETDEAKDTEGSGLDSVLFASAAARSAAEQAGLGVDSFRRQRKSSESGFTKADIERIAAGSGDTDEETD